MDKPKWWPVLIAGTVTGVVSETLHFTFGAVLFRAEVEDAFIAAGGRLPEAPSLVLQLITVGLLIGVVTVWLYAELVSRNRGGLRTALDVALMVWFLCSFVPSHTFLVSGIFPPAVLFTAMVWSLLAFCTATTLGSSLYDRLRRR